jgi:hypothetical protein
MDSKGSVSKVNGGEGAGFVSFPGAWDPLALYAQDNFQRVKMLLRETVSCRG